MRNGGGQRHHWKRKKRLRFCMVGISLQRGMSVWRTISKWRHLRRAMFYGFMYIRHSLLIIMKLQLEQLGQVSRSLPTSYATICWRIQVINLDMKCYRVKRTSDRRWKWIDEAAAEESWGKRRRCRPAAMTLRASSLNNCFPSQDLTALWYTHILTDSPMRLYDLSRDHGGRRRGYLLHSSHERQLSSRCRRPCPFVERLRYH